MAECYRRHFLTEEGCRSWISDQWRKWPRDKWPTVQFCKQTQKWHPSTGLKVAPPPPAPAGARRHEANRRAAARRLGRKGA